MPVAINRLIIAGWTGRDQSALEHHIRELEALGVKRPASTPCYYSATPSLLTTDDEVEFLGMDSSGEIEVVAYALQDGSWIGLGSDHTDRRVEAYSVSVSKQLCPKPVSRQVWRYAELAAHWDQLILRSHVVRDGRRELYQEGPMSRMRPLHELAKGVPGGFTVGSALFCGTHGAIGGIRGAERFEMELHDPVRKRSIRHAYAQTKIPVTGE